MTTLKDETENLNKVLTRLNEKVAGLEDRLDAIDLKQRTQEFEINEIRNPSDRPTSLSIPLTTKCCWKNYVTRQQTGGEEENT